MCKTESWYGIIILLVYFVVDPRVELFSLFEQAYTKFNVYTRVHYKNSFSL